MPSKKHHMGALSISKIAALESRLGKESDAAIGRDYGFSGVTIGRYRKGKGIAPFLIVKTPISKLPASDLRDIHVRLGKEPDAAIGRDYGFSNEAVGRYRNAANIPAYALGKKMAYPVPVHFPMADAKNMDKAMKKTGQKNRSEYIRGAVRDKNKEVLDG